MTAIEPAYTVDLVYPSAFGAFQAPIHLSYCAALGGRRGPNVDASFTYCDLGAGAGLTLCVLADCYPEAEFHGIDINPEHVRIARCTAKRAGLSNLYFHHASFADLSGLSLPSFDFVALSGIYSWLDASLRQATLSWVSQALAGDGLLFLHYAALPGNAQIDSLYALIREAARDVPGNSLAKFGQAIERMQALAAANAAFFRNNPYARAWLDGLPGQDQRSMAHEVLNAQSLSLSARDAANEAARHDLCYVANAQVELNHMALVAPDSLRPMLEAASPVSRDMMLDAVRNAHSRMDVLARPGASLLFCDAVGGLFLDRIDRGAMNAEREALTRATGFNFGAAICADVLATLEGGALEINAVLTHDSASHHSKSTWIEAVQYLTATKLIHLLRCPYATPPTQDVRLKSSLNRLLLEERIDSAGALPLASPVAGTQVMLPPADRLALLALVGGDFNAAWRRVEAAGQRVTDQGRAVTNAVGLARVAHMRAGQIGSGMIDRLGRLGIIEGA